MRLFYILFLFVLSGYQAISQVHIEPFPETRIIKFYPNPAVSQITFSFENGAEKDKSFQIFNFIGKKIYELQSVSSKTIVDLSNFYRGVYIFQVRNRNGKVIESGKFQVTK